MTNKSRHETFTVESDTKECSDCKQTKKILAQCYQCNARVCKKCFEKNHKYRCW